MRLSAPYLAYLVAIALKGANGAIEIALGLLISVAGPDKFYLSVLQLTRPELFEDHPVASAAAKAAQHGAEVLAQGHAPFVIFYLLVHGVLKLGIVLALIFGGRLIFPIAVLVFSVFAVFLGYHAFSHWSPEIFALFLFELITVALVFREWRSPHTMAAPP